MFHWWANAEEFGERFFKALTAYYEVFFAEEERRIYPALQDALGQAQMLAGELTVPDLLEELSRGVSMAGELEGLQTLTLAPAFWSAPLIYYHHFDEEHMLILFGARPDDASLIPGEVVPDLLVRSLKALSDPTRLKIMHYLSNESMTPTQLAHKLRLRAPTVVHHLQTLRVAGLVQVTIAEGKERSYGVRAGSVMTACDVLQRFLGIEEEAALAEEIG
jgi:DNA-binding transcriptional ArsR family regulator